LARQFTKIFFPHDGKHDHFKALDGLRGLAILFVLLSHSSNRGLMFSEYLDFSHAGKYGVYLFFVLSAYLLDRQITIAFMSNKSSRRYWINYFLRRFLRIYPLFIIALLVHGLLTMYGYTTVIDKAIDIPMHIFLLAGEYIFWSIPVEFKYYFISPLILWGFHRLFKWDLNKIMISLALLTMLSIIIELIFELPTIVTLRFFPIFLAGTFIAILEVLKGKKFLQNISPYLIDSSGIIAFILVILSVPFYTQRVFGTSVDFDDSVYYLPYGILWGSILVAAKYGKGIMKRFFELRFLRFIGTISFSMYLFHIPVLKLLIRSDLGIPDNLKVYIFFICAIIVSMLSFLFIERPLSRIRIYHKELREEEIKRNERQG
jgi:peptidoglycan/LPS O-acetylase OafA/YrhL